MPTFDQYVAKHGEFGAQALIEQIELVSGIRANVEAPLPLDMRWSTAMQQSFPQQRLTA